MDNAYTFGCLDGNRINIHENYEVEYWAKTLDVSAEVLKKAVTTAGNTVDAIKGYLNR